MRIERLRSVDSTNLYIRRYLPQGEDVIVTADVQTGGRGTKGRVFLSEAGGVYFSALRFYEGVPAKNAFSVMTHAAVAVCRTARFFGAELEIKWPNDVLVGGRKLAGILIENGFAGDALKWSIVGIGVNAENDVSALGGIAVNLSQTTGRRVSASAAREKLIEEYGAPSAFGEYLSFVKFLGKRVTVTEGEKKFSAMAKLILPDGRLLIEDESGERALSAAEISLGLGGAGQ